MSTPFELGLYTFGDLTPVAQTGKTISAQQRLNEILAAAKLADASGLDVFAAGEHHRLDMAVSATAVVLAAIAATTQRIRLASAVTILSTADPVTVFEDFATLDLISGGRAEIIAGRGIFTESFPLFGYDLANYNELFQEKLELLMGLTPPSGSPGRAAFVLAWTMSRFRRARRKAACRSGSEPAVRKAASKEPANSDCPWRWPISACRPQSWRRWSSFTAARDWKPNTRLRI